MNRMQRETLRYIGSGMIIISFIMLVSFTFALIITQWHEPAEKLESVCTQDNS